MSKLVIGLTGGIGSGKSTITHLFEKQGIDIVDADVVAREVVEPGQPALYAIAQHFGQQVLSPNGELDRRKLRELVFSDPLQKDWLNALLHPLIRNRMQQQTQQAKSVYSILAMPLLIENGLDNMVDKVLVVDVDEDKQVARTCQRDMSDEAQVRSIMASQATRQQRLARADYVIENNGSEQDLRPKVELLHLEFLKVASRA